MSYWVYLESEGREPVTVTPHVEGGTHVMGGTSAAELNVTYNYSEVYSIFEFSLKDLHGKRAVEMAPILAAIVKKCGTRRFDDYWAPTPGNAGHALNILLGWAQAYPDAVFRVS